jgi:hypothetical protein
MKKKFGSRIRNKHPRSATLVTGSKIYLFLNPEKITFSAYFDSDSVSSLVIGTISEFGFELAKIFESKDTKYHCIHAFMLLGGGGQSYQRIDFLLFYCAKPPLCVVNDTGSGVTSLNAKSVHKIEALRYVC